MITMNEYTLLKPNLPPDIAPGCVTQSAPSEQDVSHSQHPQYKTCHTVSTLSTRRVTQSAPSVQDVSHSQHPQYKTCHTVSTLSTRRLTLSAPSVQDVSRCQHPQYKTSHAVSTLSTRRLTLSAPSVQDVSRCQHPQYKTSQSVSIPSTRCLTLSAPSVNFASLSANIRLMWIQHIAKARERPPQVNKLVRSPFERSGLYLCWRRHCERYKKNVAPCNLSCPCG